MEGLNDTLISFGQICDQERIVFFTANNILFLKISIIDLKKVEVLLVTEIDIRSGLYALNNFMHHRKHNSGKKLLQVQNLPTDIKLWHNRLVHLNEAAINKLHKHATNFPRLSGAILAFNPCLLEKEMKKGFSSNFNPAEYSGEIVHTDLAGPLPKSMHSAKYACTFTDLNTRF